jgi:MFS transporter, MHS family, proline/betaine transporter
MDNPVSIGAVIFGHVGDRLGRRPALAFSLLLMTAATVVFRPAAELRRRGLRSPNRMILDVI